MENSILAQKGDYGTVGKRLDLAFMQTYFLEDNVKYPYGEITVFRF